MPVEASDRLVGLVRAALPSGKTIGVALSGGGDSVALLHLCLAAGLPVEAVTVDHGLRDGSAAEAVAVAADCAALRVRHEARVWVHGTVPGNLMDRARRARMVLIRDWARDRGIAVVALGHTRDDQAETLLMGLARAAGIDGLSGMRREWSDAGVRFLRPLLDAGREELRDWLRVRNIGWIEDPTNENDRFLRVKARRVLAALKPMGITAEGLAAAAGHLAQVKAALKVQVVDAAARLLREEAGSLAIDPGIQAEPHEVRRRLIVAGLMWLSAGEYAPRADAVARLEAAIAAGRDATLWGCRWRSGRMMREAKAVGGAVPLGALWDGRWVLEGPGVQGAEVRALGAAGLSACPDWRAAGLPREVLVVTPALWEGTALIAAPVAGMGRDWSARIAAPFHLFGLSD